MKVEVDSKGWREAMAEYRAAMKLDLAAALKNQARLYLRDVLALMKPESGPKGKKNVARDIANVFRTKAPIGNARALAARLASDVEAGAAFAKSRTNRKLGERIRILSARGDANALLALFQNGALTRRSSDARIVNAPDRAIHRAAKYKGFVPANARNRWVIYAGKKSALNQYVRAVQARVGKARAGWAAAAREVGLSLPAFVSRHGSAGGSVRSVSTLTETSIEVINRDPAAVQQDAQFNMSARAHDMRLTSMHEIAERIAKRNADKASQK